MAYTDLSAEQQQDLAEFFRDFRPAVADFVRACRTFRDLVTIYGQNVAPVWATVASDDIIPDGSGLANSGTMTKADWNEIIAWANNVQTDLYGAGGTSAVSWPDAETIDSYGILAAGPSNV